MYSSVWNKLNGVVKEKTCAKAEEVLFDGEGGAVAGAPSGEKNSSKPVPPRFAGSVVDRPPSFDIIH